MKFPFSSWPQYSQEEIDAVSKVLTSGCVNYWTGSEGRNFEREFADFCGASYAVALANGTVALELALRSLDIGPGHEVIVTSRTFIASANAIALVGATPVFADVDINSQNITSRTVEKVLTGRTKAVVVVHLAGWPCEMDELLSIADEHGLAIVEDCAQAHGAIYKDRLIGSIGHVAAWSFCQDKIMTTGGEGGMLTTNDKTIWEKAWSFKDHGKSWNTIYEHQHPPGFRWLHESIGTNWRMTEMQAAIGRIQLNKVSDWHRKRTKNAENILSVCSRFPEILRVPQISPDKEHAWYKCYVFVIPEGLKTNWNRDRIMIEINTRGVPCYTGSCSEIYLEKAFDNTGWRPKERFPNAQVLGETSLMFLVHPTLTSKEISKTCSIIEEVMISANR